MADPLGANTNRIGRAMIKRLEKETGEHWKFLIANHHAQPSIETTEKNALALMQKELLHSG